MKKLIDASVISLSENSVVLFPGTYAGVDIDRVVIEHTSEDFLPLRIGDKVTFGIQFGEDDEEKPTEPTSEKVGKKV